jgi:hypothetical protein
MGYTHYLKRQEIIEQSAFNSILLDFKKLLPKFDEYGIQLADGVGKNISVLNNKEITFNGKRDCGHRKDEEIVIPWPSKDAGGVANNWKEDAKVGDWFAGAEINKRTCNGDCSYETFKFPLKMELNSWDEPKNNLYFDFCKTAFRPYDLAVISFLIIAKHHLKDNIIVSSDGEDGHWFDGKMLCQMILGYGLDYVINEESTLIQEKGSSAK